MYLYLYFHYLVPKIASWWGMLKFESKWCTDCLFCTTGNHNFHHHGRIFVYFFPVILSKANRRCSETLFPKKIKLLNWFCWEKTNHHLVCGSKYFFLPLLGAMIQFDKDCSNGLVQPPRDFCSHLSEKKINFTAAIWASEGRRGVRKTPWWLF